MKLKRFIKECGTRQAAADRLGVSVRTLDYWRTEERKPHGLSLKALKENGVELGK